MGIKAKLFTRPPGMGDFDDSAPLVFNHQDLNMRNMIVGDDGRLWLIDFGLTGWYPRWFEYVAMKKLAKNEERVVKRKEPLWDTLIPFICNPYYQQERWLKWMGQTLDYF